MAADKRWNGTGGTDGDLNDADNWDSISIRNATYKWVVSGSGTSEYYLDLFAGGDPGVPVPAKVLQNSVAMTAGTAGSLTAGQWAFADNDTLGYSTIYVRLSDSTDPDTKTTGYVSYRSVLKAGDNVRFPAGSGAVTTNVDQSSTTVGLVVFEDGFLGTVASATANLKLSCTGLIFQGKGLAFIDVGASAISPQINGTASASDGSSGLYLIGSALATVTVTAGRVGIAARHGEAAAVTTCRALGGTTIIGAGASVTTIQVNGGFVYQRCTATTTTVYGGSHIAQEAAAQTTLNVEGGSSVHNSTGTVGTANCNGGALDVQQGTVSTLNHNRRTATVRYSQAATVTTYNKPSGPVELIAKPL